jgi:hypothetical protein
MDKTDAQQQANLINNEQSVAAKHTRLKSLLHPITIGGIDNPLAEVEYKGKRKFYFLSDPFYCRLL